MRILRSLSLFSILLTVAFLSASPSGYGQPSETPSTFQIPESNEGLPGTGPIRRYDWFRKLWEQRRSEWNKHVQEDQGSVVFLGDSITQGWGNDMGGSFPGLKVANRGISGDTTRGVLIRLDQDVLSLNPRAVVLLIGTNDLEEKAVPETIAGNLRLIMAKLKQHNAQMPIVLCQVFPSSAEKKRPADRIRKINELYTLAVKGDSQITLIDTWRLFANLDGDATKDEFPDLLHPNKAGYTKWAGALRPIFATLGLLETEPDNFEIEEGFESLFNGHDLTGWGYRPSSEADIQTKKNWHGRDPNAPPWPIITEAVDFTGKSVSHDARYLAKNDRLVVTTPPEGRKIQQIWTTREFQNDFILVLEFRASPFADSGVFLRGRQLQCRDYLLAGPYKELHRYRPQDWNELVVTVKGELAQATCNGEILESTFKVPETGPIGLEGDRGQVEYRRIRIKEIH